MFKFLIIIMFVSIPVFASEECKVVKGFNLCDDAITIANNTKADIGLIRKNSEYVLKSVYAKNMVVISAYESIYTKDEIIKIIQTSLINRKINGSTINEKFRKVKDDATKRLCEFYKNDVFVKDGGSFKVSYSFKNGDIFHTVLAEKNNCREIEHS